MHRTRSLPIVASLLPAIVFLAVYVPRVGHGFVLDDYRWILDSRGTSLQDLVSLFGKNLGFYRPAVSLSFALDYAAFGPEPLWYGLTNVVLALLCGTLVYALSRDLGLPWGAAALAGSLWLLNFHGINMAVLWISGRTALLLTAAALAAGICIARRRVLGAAAFTAIALFSKEEAVALPLILAAWVFILNLHDRHRLTRTLVLWTACSAALLSAYLGLRSQSGAMTPSTAPGYYRFTFVPAAIGRNVLEYADRSLTLSGLIVIAAWLVLRRKVRVALPTGSGRLFACAAVWLAGGYCLTVFLPVRSSLYACFPSVGACLIAAWLCAAFWATATESSRTAAIIVAIVVTLAAAPIHYSRTRRLVEQAEVSQSLWSELPALTEGVPDGATVLIHDDTSRRANVRSAFGGLIGQAFELRTGRHVNFWIEPSSSDGGGPRCPDCVARTLVCKNGRLYEQHQPSRDRNQTR